MTFQKGPSEVVIRAGRVSKCGRFAMSFGPSGKIDGADEANETDGNGRTDEYKKKACKAFS